MYAKTSDGRTIEFDVRGTGPNLLLPQCNAPWGAYVDIFASRYRVITVSPRGYFGSSREPLPSTYTPQNFRNDLITAVDTAGIDTFFVFGYSLTAALAAYLATTCTRVTALAAGGFPLFGSFSAVAARVMQQHPVGQPSHLDWEANRGLYKGLAALPMDGYLAALTCDRLAFWGTQDDNVALAMPVLQQREALIGAGFSVEEFPRLDHQACVFAVDLVIPMVDHFFRFKQAASSGTASLPDSWLSPEDVRRIMEARRTGDTDSS